MARLRERMYSAALQQEVEYVERGEGDVLSRLSVDSNIVGDRYVVPALNTRCSRIPCCTFHTAIYLSRRK